MATMDENKYNSMPANVQKYLNITAILNYGLTVIIYFCFITQILFLFFFCYRIMIQRLPTFTSAYFKILLLQYIINSIDTVVLHIATKTNFSFNFFLTIISTWYLYRFYAFCNTVLVLNRFTGVFYFKQHGRIWSGRRLKLIFLIVIAYPFFLSGYTLGNVGYCLSEETRQKCGMYFAPTTNLPTHIIASNLINAILALIFGISTALARKIKENDWQKKHKYENHLLIQSIITSAILMFYEILVLIRSTNDWTPPSSEFDYGWNIRVYLIITGIGIAKQIFHVSSILLLFIISQSVRESFLSFYYLDLLLCRKKKSNALFVTTVSTSHHLNGNRRTTYPVLFK